MGARPSHSTLARAAAYGVIAIWVAPYFYHLALGGGGELALVVDDFWYYALTAREWVLHGRPSFDGQTLTNGFHPLFMALVTAGVWLTGGLGPAFFALLAAVFAIAGCVSFELYLRLGRRLAPDSQLAPALALGVTLETIRMIAFGMETTLVLPLHLWVLERVAAPARVTPRRAAALGFGTSLLVLARLDEALLAALLVGGALLFARASWREKFRAALAFGAGGALVPAYLALNWLVFGGLLPVSGEAKQLTTHFAWNSHMLGELAGSALGAAAIPLVPLALAALAFDRRLRIEAGPRFAALLALGFPLAFYLVWGLRSDWSLFQWYLYPLPAAIFVAALLLSESVAARLPRLARIGALPATLAVAAAVLIGAGAVARSRTFDWTPASSSIYDVALRLRDVFAERPGVVAMGDRAGVTSHLLGRPIVQLEGLVGDRALVERIRRADPLDEVLRDYRVDYLIVSVYAPLERDGDCYRVTQPETGQAGQRSPKMVGRFCGAPVAQFETPVLYHWTVTGSCYTYVFDVRAARGQTSAAASASTNPL